MIKERRGAGAISEHSRCVDVSNQRRCPFYSSWALTSYWVGGAMLSESARVLTPFADKVRAGIHDAGHGWLDNEHATWEKIAMQLDQIARAVHVHDITASGVTGAFVLSGRHDGNALAFYSEYAGVDCRVIISDVNGWRNRCRVQWIHGSELTERIVPVDELGTFILDGCSGRELPVIEDENSSCVLL